MRRIKTVYATHLDTFCINFHLNKYEFEPLNILHFDY